MSGFPDGQIFRRCPPVSMRRSRVRDRLGAAPGTQDALVEITMSSNPRLRSFAQRPTSVLLVGARDLMTPLLGAGYHVVFFETVLAAFRYRASDAIGAVVEAELGNGDGLVLATRLKMPGQSIFPLVVFRRSSNFAVLGHHLAVLRGADGHVDTGELLRRLKLALEMTRALRELERTIQVVARVSPRTARATVVERAEPKSAVPAKLAKTPPPAPPATPAPSLMARIGAALCPRRRKAQRSPHLLPAPSPERKRLASSTGGWDSTPTVINVAPTRRGPKR